MTERQMQLEDWLDDLCVRFIINLPQDNLATVERICFQIEEAQWFYEDFIRPLDPNLPSFSLRNFSLRVFSHCPLLSAFALSGRHMQAFDEFMAYKSRIPVRGAIMLNEAMDATVLVKGWKKNANWSFPRGKINKDEDDLICAIREVYEETGLDLEAAGLIPEDRQVKHIEINIREQQMRLYVFKNVPMDTHFEPRTRKEISKIQWWRLSDLPAFKKKNQNNQEAANNANKFYMVAPFLVPLRKWISAQQKASLHNAPHPLTGLIPDGFLTEDDRGEESATQAHYDVSAPESNGIEEASEALSRLLKSQPGTQGLQPNIDVHAVPQTQNSGQALLALLQSKPANPLPSQHPPHTPLEQMMGMAPIPNPPYHQHPHPPRFSKMPPAPQFALQQQLNLFPTQNPNLPQQPLSTQFQHQQDFPRDTAPRQHINPHHNQPQHLVHPQPLPPNVQKAVFTGGTIPSIPPQWNVQQSNNIIQPIPQPPLFQVPTGDIRSRPPAQLNSHSLSLLNVFKTGSGPVGNLTAPMALSHQSQVPAQDHPQELPADLSHVTPTLQQASVPQIQPKLGVFAPKSNISAEQKSTLLGMFKSPPAQSSIVAKELTATALPIANTPSAVELSAVEPLSSGPQAADQERKSTQTANGQVPELNPEANLPFRAMKILARPAAKSDTEDRTALSPRHTPGQSSRKQAQHATVGKSKVSHVTQAPTQIFAPQILKRPQPAPPKETVSISIPSPNIPEAPAPVPERRGTVERDASPEHKQTLLSLFGKPSAAPSILPSPIVSRSSTLDVVSALSPADQISKSRIGSIVSLEPDSRRGSQPSLSKANENFLLGYLDAFAGGRQR